MSKTDHPATPRIEGRRMADTARYFLNRDEDKFFC